MQRMGQHGLFLVEANTQCYLGRHKGKLAGSFGDIASFSLQGSKHITCGEGGVLLTRSQTLADKIRAFASVGYDSVGARKGEIDRNKMQDPDFIRHVSLGYKYKMSDACAAIALAQLGKLEALVEQRQECARILSEPMCACAWLHPQYTDSDTVHSFYTLAARANLEQAGCSWKELRAKFIELGGHGFYAPWRLTFQEPMWGCGDFRMRDTLAPFNGSPATFRAHYEALCPNAVQVQQQVIQLKTNYYELDEAREQATILARTLACFGK